MFATLTRAAGVFFCLTCPFEKRHVFVIFCVFWLIFCQYWSIFVRTYLLDGTAYCTVLRMCVLYDLHGFHYLWSATKKWNASWSRSVQDFGRGFCSGVVMKGRSQDIQCVLCIHCVPPLNSRNNK